MFSYSKTLIAVVLVLVGFIGVPTTLILPFEQSTAIETRVSALETTVAELQASNMVIQTAIASIATITNTTSTQENNVKAPTPKFDANLPVIAITPNSFITPTLVTSRQPDATETPIPPSTQFTGAISSAMVGNASPAIPAPNDDVYQIIILQQEESGAWIGVRNNSNETVNIVNVNAIARSSGGSLLAVGESGRLFLPLFIKPGEVAIGYVGFGSARLPKDATYEYEVKATQNSYSGIMAELRIEEYNLIDSRIVGMVQNPGNREAGSIWLTMFCFDESGNFLSSRNDIIYKNLSSKDSAPFQIDLPERCQTYLLYAYGW